MSAISPDAERADSGENPFDLARFVRAQAPVFDRAIAELHAGAKASHWMWFVFPQLRGLGASHMAQVYGLSGLAEAQAYLRHPTLSERLRLAVAAAQSSPAISLRALLGAPDDLKFRSSMTLFELADPQGPYQAALDRWCGGQRDTRTIAAVSAAQRV